MSAGAVMMLAALILAFASLIFLIAVLVRTIQTQRDRRRSIWKEFALGLSLVILFFATWVGHGISEWQEYTDTQREHEQPVELGDFISQFSASTLENWQSEFLQLFSFVVLAALYIHKGSAESKDSDEKMEASLRRIEEKLGTLPDDAPKKKADSWKLPETPLKVGG